MTTHKTLKRRIRARSSKTGESYTAARAQVLRHAPAPDAAALTGTSDEAVIRATGRPLGEWLSLVDGWDGTSRTHTEIARWLVAEHGVPAWWAQSLTVGYERARGMRAVHQQGSGFSVSVTRTVRGTPDSVAAMVIDPIRRAAWLPDALMSERTSRPGKSARYDWPAPASRVVFDFAPKGTDRTVVAVTHAKLPDADAAAEMKEMWRDRLTALRDLAADG